jgi:hypothetical protein
MPKFLVHVSETLQHTFLVTAESRADIEAMDIDEEFADDCASGKGLQNVSDRSLELIEELDEES